MSVVGCIYTQHDNFSFILLFFLTPGMLSLSLSFCYITKNLLKTRVILVNLYNVLFFICCCCSSFIIFLDLNDLQISEEKQNIEWNQIKTYVKIKLSHNLFTTCIYVIYIHTYIYDIRCAYVRIPKFYYLIISMEINNFFM